MAAPPLTHRNHFVPAALVGDFSSEPLVRDRRRAIVDYAMKGQGPKRPMAAEALFCINDFYTLPKFSTPLEVGLLVHTWSRIIPLPTAPRVEEATIVEDLTALAGAFSQDGDLRPDMVERLLAAEVDGPFDEVVQRIRAGAAPTADDIDVCMSFLQMLFLRSEAWFKSPTQRRMSRHSRRNGRRQTKLSGEVSDEAWEHPVAALQEVVLRKGAYLFHLAQAASERRAALSADRFSLQVLEAPAGSGFVLTDTAGRPYLSTEDPRSISRVARGMDNTGVVITFPIGPGHCLRVRRRGGDPRFQRVPISDAQVREINTALLTMAVRTIVFPEGRQDVFLPGVSVATSAPWSEP